MKKVVIVALLISMISLTGCEISKNKVAEYNSMKSTLEFINSDIDIDKYNNALLFIMSDEAKYRDTLETGIKQYSDVLGDSIYTKLIGESLGDSKNNIEKGEEYYSNPYNNVDIGKKRDKYAIYAEHYTITGYGTKEQAQEALDDFNSLPLNSITQINYYQDMITVRMDNKYTGEKLLRVTLKDGKIQDYKIMEKQK